VRDDFAIFILTHGRPDRVITLTALERAGYTGRVYLVVDDEDPTREGYQSKYGDKVLLFSKDEVAKTFDLADNFHARKGVVVFARNACWDLARQVGCKYFMEMDDDYDAFYYRFDSQNKYGSFRVRATMDRLLSALVAFYARTSILTVALSQGGDHMGGDSDGSKRPRLRRKAMGSFLLSTDRPFTFTGRINEDVNAYTNIGRQGYLFFMLMNVMLNTKTTQQDAGGMTSAYLDGGTYVKSFYSVMHCPSAVQIGALGDPRSPQYRIHHKINWNNAAPKIIREGWKKPTLEP